MGRPPVSKTEPTEQCTVRLTPSQREKLARLGGAAWVRAQIDSADVKRAMTELGVMRCVTS